MIVVVVTAVAALANWWSRVRHHDRLEMVSKPLTTAGAIAIAATAGGPRDATTTAIVALSLCLAGDIALLAVIDRFVAGLAAFLLGHIAFIVMFVQLGVDRWPLTGVGIAFCALLLGTVAVPILRGAASKGFGVPVRAYLAVISAMCVVGWATGNWLVMLGATVFVISDTILGWDKFVVGRSWMHVAIMFTYHVAIVSLALSLKL
jgi:uncharacterized membrane protein YhhN